MDKDKSHEHLLVHSPIPVYIPEKPQVNGKKILIKQITTREGILWSRFSKPIFGAVSMFDYIFMAKFYIFKNMVSEFLTQP